MSVFITTAMAGCIREVFADFDPSTVAKMDEDTTIAEISGNKELKLAEARVRCIVENAKCIQKASRSMDLNELNCSTHLDHKDEPLKNFFFFLQK